MKYYVIAGEASGDLHGSNLLQEIKNWMHQLLSAAGVAIKCRLPEHN